MPEAPESWGTIPIDDLMDLLQATTERMIGPPDAEGLRGQYAELAMDEAAYHRKFWATWQELPADMSIAALNRECEMVCRHLNESVILSRAVLESLLAKRDALVAILAARAK